MSDQRKSPISYNLNSYKAEFNGYTFYFSTPKHAEKFEREVDARVAWLTDSLCRRFHLWVQCDMLAAVQLYMMIEGRGFKVVSEETGRIATSPDDLLFEFVMINAGGKDG